MWVVGLVFGEGYVGSGVSFRGRCMWVVGLVFGEGYVGSGVSFRGRVCG